MISFGPAHGGEVYTTARRLGIAVDDLVDFSSNANIFAYSLTHSIIEETPYPFVHYPDSSAEVLLTAISRHERVTKQEILPGNGSADLIWHFFQQRRPQKVLFIGPIFSEFVTACRALNLPFSLLETTAKTGFALAEEDYSLLEKSNADLVVLCTPNNPACLAYPAIERMINAVHAPALLIDNSYREFLAGTPEYETNHYHQYQRFLQPGTSLFTLHSFTKFFCCPGIRLGYLLGPAGVLQDLHHKRPAWMITTYSQLIGEKLLAAINVYRETLPPLRNAVTETGLILRSALSVDAKAVFEGPGYLLFRLAKGISATAATDLLLQKRILVRNCDSIPGMPPGFIRVQARPGGDRELLRHALSGLAQ